MTASKYPKAQAFLDAHPGTTVEEAIKILDFQIREIDLKLGGNNAEMES